MSQTNKVRQRLSPSERREKILGSASEEFASHPYASVTITSIAAASESSNALVYRYFESKEHLYVEVLKHSFHDLEVAQDQALSALPPGVSVRDRLRVALGVYLGFVADAPSAWFLPYQRAAGEPAAAATFRADMRQSYVDKLSGLLKGGRTNRKHYSLWGFLGFLDAACGDWVSRGCPPDQHDTLIETSLGALEGALGDWSA